MSVHATLLYLPIMVKRRNKEMACTFYIAEALRIISDNTAKLVSGSYMNIKLMDLILDQPEETRTPDEVIEHMKGALSALGEGGEK